MLKKMRSSWNRLNKWIRAGIIVSVLVVFYTLTGFFLVPFAAKKVVLAKLPQLLSRDVSIESVYFNPYTLRLKVKGFEIDKKEGDGKLFSFKTFDINFDSFSLFRLSTAFEMVEIDDPQLDISIYRGGSSISDLMPEKADTEEPVEDSGQPKKIFPFILRNLVLRNGTCRVYDKVRDMQHVISDLNLSVPFTSSLKRDTDRQVQPTLKMVINGTPFSLKGNSLPFNSTLKTEFNFSLENAHLGEYWAYLPIYETTTLKSGVLNTELTLSFDRSDYLLPKILISGRAAISNFDLAVKKGPSFLKFRTLDMDFDELSILRRVLNIRSVKLTDPYLKIGLKKDGSPDLLDYLTPSVKAGEKTKEEAGDPAPALAALVQEFVLENGQIDFIDNAFSEGFKKKIAPISVRADNISTSENVAGTYNFNIGSNATEIIKGKGGMTLMPLVVNGSVSVADLDIPDYHTYLDGPLPLDVASGKVGLGSDFVFAPKTETMSLSNVRVDVGGLDLQPKGGGKTLIGLSGFAMTNGTVDVKEKSVFIDSINLNKALIKLMRDRKGIDLVKYLEKHKQDSAAAAEDIPVETDVQETVAQTEQKKWQVALNKFQLSDSTVEFTDTAATKTTRTQISDINIGVKGVTYPEKKPLQLSVGATINGRGFLTVKGKAGPESLKAQGSVQLRKFRLRDFNGYLPPKMQLNIASGHIDVNGDWKFSAAGEPVASYTGKVQLKDLIVRDNHGNKKFMHLNEFSVRGIDFVSSPLRVNIDSVGVVEPKVHLEREPDGTFNIGRMLTGERAAPINATLEEKMAAEVAAKSKIDQLHSIHEQGDVSGLATPTAKEKEDNFLFVGKMFMTNGTVIFKDYVVKPAFELDISKMRSAVRGLELPKGDRMDLSFNATFDQQAPLVAEGFLQPTSEGADTDLNVSIVNLDMTQLSPYTEKFIAYPVSTGMLSSDVAIKLRGKYLAVENVFDIYQFEVGDKVDNPDAPNIPIGLGLALLRDSNGNIRLDIPVEGDLSDPQFRLGRVIGRAIVNLLVKAVTSPFALIGALVGGGEDMDVLAFEPGTPAPKDDELSKVESIAKAMHDRPGIKLQVSGFTAPEDIPAMEKAEFRRQVAMPKYLELESDGKAPESVDQITLTEEEYPEYLETAYKDAPFDKPKNFLGIVTALPVPEMEKALRDNIKIADTQLAELARQRAEIVRRMLTEKSGVAPERIFLKGMSATGKGNGPRVELGLQ